MPDYDTLIFSDDDRVATITLNRPGVGNKTNMRMVKELLDLCHFIEDESKASVVILRGAGGVFCEGIDLGDFDPDKPLDIHGFNKWEKVCTALERLKKITAAVIEGSCVGGGVQLALVCDVRLAETNSSLRFNEVEMGFIPGLATFRLAKYIGLGRAKHCILTGRSIAAKEALQIGLVDKVYHAVDENEVLQETIAEFMPFNPDSLELSRRLLNESFATSYEDFTGHFLAAQHRAISGKAFQEQLRKEGKGKKFESGSKT
jgi:enoyl-CoA hydratase/carnithine racemase